jgi:hypothetical protein
MDQNHILLIVLLLLSEMMGAIPENYVWMNGFLDILCKGIKEALKKPENSSPEDTKDKIEV